MKKVMGFIGRLTVYVIVCAFVVAFIVTGYLALRVHQRNKKIIASQDVIEYPVDDELTRIKLDQKIEEIVKDAYATYQSDMQNMLAVAAIVFALFTFGFPFLQHQFITKEHLDKMEKGLDGLDRADDQIQQAVEAAGEAKTAQENQQAVLEAMIRQNQEEYERKITELHTQLSQRIEPINQVIRQINQLRQDLQKETASQVEMARIELVSLNQATGQAPAKQQPKLGEKNFRFGNILWHVLELDVANNRVLLLSKDIIERRTYNDRPTEVTWETCTLRKYLNGEFYKSFKADRSRIALTHNENPDNTWGRTKGKPFSTPGGNPTYDCIFLLSVAEILKYFPGLKLHKDEDGNGWDYESDERLAAKFNNSGSWWWLRSPGGNQSGAAYVDRDGDVSLSGGSVSGEGGVRPALWLNL